MPQEWHRTPEFREMVRAFHNQYARFPEMEIREANTLHERFTTKIRDRLQSQKYCTRVEYTGSSYEKIKVPASDLEFDCMFVLTGGEKLKVVPAGAGYARLKPKQPVDEMFKKFMNADGEIEPILVMRKFFGLINKTIIELRETDYKNGREKFVMRGHGPAVQLDVYNSNNQLNYSVDMVPAYATADGNLYVAKPLKSDPAITWRRSYSLKEKEIMNNIDEGNGCRRMCLRIMKVIRERDTTLNHLETYCLKTALLHTKGEKSGWGPNDVGIGLVMLMEKIAAYLEKGQMPHYFVPQLNLLSSYGRVQMEKISTRLRRIVRSEAEMKKLLSVTSGAERGADSPGKKLSFLSV